MPGRFFLTRPVSELAECAGVAAPLDERPRHDIQPGQNLLTLTSDGFLRMRWGMIPTGRKNARGRPVMNTIINARAETVFDKSAFEKTRRAVVPVDGWYEWTGEARRKTVWAIQSKDGAPLWFAAIYDIWDGPGGLKVPQIATLTCPSNADIKDIQHRMGVLLSAETIQTWLTADQAMARSLLRPWPDGRLRITKTRVDDGSAPKTIG